MMIWTNKLKLNQILKTNQSLVLRSKLNNIHQNLALENTLLDKLAPMDRPVLYLWRNGTCIVLGRNQNPWSECDVKTMRRDSVALSRRHSGGGAVYQDLGVSVFTFLYPGTKLTPSVGNSILIKAIHSLTGLTAEPSGRNDLLIQKSKFSGAAFRILGDKSIHHGTIMRSLNLDNLEKYLTPSALKLRKVN